MTWKKLTLDDHLTFRVLPDASNQFGRLARDMQDTYDGLLYYSPGFLLDHQAGAMATMEATSQQSILLLGHHDLFHSPRLNRSTDVRHELRHIRIYEMAKNGDPSPYHGGIEAIEGRILDDENPHFRPYSKRLIFSEMTAYHHQSREELAELLRLLKRIPRDGAPVDPEDRALIDRQIEITHVKIQNWFVTSSRSQNVVRFMRKNLAEILPLSEFTVTSTTSGLTFIAPRIATPSGTLKLSMPLVDAKEHHSPRRNERTLRSQLYWLLQTSLLHTEISAKALVRFEFIKDSLWTEPETAYEKADQLYRGLLKASNFLP